MSVEDTATLIPEMSRKTGSETVVMLSEYILSSGLSPAAGKGGWG